MHPFGLSFNEHIVRYNTYFTLLAALSSSTIFAFDQRGFGQTGHTAPPPLAEIEGAEGLALGKLLRSKPGRTNTEQQKEDIAFWVKRESNLRGGKVWIYGHSMVSSSFWSRKILGLYR
jgi:pimeloyl-ACP methyl ester carboxylesterase